MATRELKLFGQPAVVGVQGTTAIRLKRCGLLLALLVASPGGMDRAALAEQLWKEGGEAARLRRLRRLIFEVRTQLGEDALLEQGGRLALSDAWLAQCDYGRYLRQYHRLIHRGENVENTDAEFSVVSAAREPLLGNWEFDEQTQASEWLDFQRVAQSNRCRRMRDKIVASLLAVGAGRDALQMMLADIERDPLDEAGWEQAATMLFDAGRYAECAALYHSLRGNLAQAIGLDASAAFRRLAQQAEAKMAMQNVWSRSRPVTSYVDAGDVHIAWQCFGTGKVDLLIIPGFVSNVEMAWELPQLASFFERVAKDFRVLIFDRRGIGLSDRTARHSSSQTAVDDVLAVLDAADSKTAVVFGASEGGPNAIQLCTAQPQRVQALCLYGALAKGTASASYTSALTHDQYDRWRTRLVADWGTARSLPAFAPSHVDDATLNDWWARLLRLSSSPGAIAAILDQLRDADVTALLPKVTCPVTLIHRRGDQAVRIESSRYMATHIPNARLVELEGDDHWWWLDDIDVLLGELRALRVPNPLHAETTTLP